jgi:hypothetical protein
MIKILMIIFLVVGLVVGSAFSYEPSDEGPTVIIVGPERDGHKTLNDQQPENGDQYLIQKNDQEEESPDSTGTESPNSTGNEGEYQDQQENPFDQQNTHEYQQDTESSE